MTNFDHIVVGAGAAGCALAARLSEDRGTRVLLLEAGTRARRPQVRIPAAFPELFRTSLDWAYDSAPEDELNGRRLFIPRGRAIGGSSVMNAQMWVPGRAEDYDGWEAEGWSWPDVAPALERARRQLLPEPLRDPNPLTGAFLDTAQAAGMRRLDDLGGADLEGAGSPLVTQHRGRRFHVADAYLAPARSRANLQVRTGARVLRLNVQDGRATGVLLADGRGATEVRARSVTLCAGSIESPHLLMASGIGPAEHLRAHGIDVQSDLPSVGQHLQDHVFAPLYLETHAPITLTAAKSPRQVLRYLLRRRGMLSSNAAEAAAFVHSAGGPGIPDLEILLCPFLYRDHGQTPPGGHGFSLAPLVLAPRSRGSVMLGSADPLAAPVIRPRCFTDPEGEDLATAVRGIRLARKLAATGALAAHVARELSPGIDVHRDADLEAYVRESAELLYHPVGTCRIGDVVDERLRVRGIDGLRVADAAVMPKIVHGHPMAATLAIAERAADLIAHDAGRTVPAAVEASAV